MLRLGATTARREAKNTRRGIPIGIPPKNKNRYFLYKSISYQSNSNYPGPPNKLDKKGTWRLSQVPFLCPHGWASLVDQSPGSLTKGAAPLQDRAFAATFTPHIAISHNGWL